MADVFTLPAPTTETLHACGKIFSTILTYNIHPQHFEDAVLAIPEDRFAIRFTSTSSAQLKKSINFAKKSQIVLLGNSTGESSHLCLGGSACISALAGTQIDLNRNNIHIDGSSLCMQDFILTNGEVSSMCQITHS
jgi:hypothetical protein